MNIYKQIIVLGSLIFLLFLGVSNAQAADGCCVYKVESTQQIIDCQDSQAGSADKCKAEYPITDKRIGSYWFSSACATIKDCDRFTNQSAGNSSKSTTTPKKLGGLATTASNAGYGERELTDIAGSALRIALSLVGVLFLLLMIYGGFTWMTAGGNEKTAGKGKTIIAAAALGLIMVVAAYLITSFVGDSIIS